MSTAALSAVGRVKRDLKTRVRTDESQKAFVFLAGVSDSSIVEDWLQTQSNQDAFGVLLNDSTRLTSLFSATTRGNAIASSVTAMNILGANSTAIDTVVANDAAMSVIGNSNMAIGKVVAGAAGLDPTAYADMDAMVASQTAVDAVVASQAAVGAVAASQIALSALDSLNPVSIPTLVDSDPRAVASSMYSSSYAPWKAFNGTVINSGWAPQGDKSTNEWVSWDFGIPVWCYRALYASSETDGAPDEAIFECADDINGPWEAAANVLPETGTTAEQDFAMDNAVGKKRFWRMRNLIQSTTYFRVGKLQFWGIA